MFSIIYLLLGSYTCFSLAHPQVTAPTGTYIGREISSYDDNQPYNSFRGIKYANVVERFKEAVPVREGRLTYNASQFGPACYQNNAHHTYSPIAEDCLYLNVYSPHVNGSLPVIVFIHGGAFVFGFTKDYGPDYFMETERVVVVTIAYRLGAFGFLYLDDPAYPANLGIRDQILALQWVQRNVKHFGGDPNRVTINGQSAGAVSVTLLMSSPLAKGLFIGAISESGVINGWGLQPRCFGIERRRILAQLTDCDQYLPNSGESAEKLVRCLHNKSPAEIMEATAKFPFYDSTFPFTPIVEATSAPDPVITSFPLVQDKSAKLLPWIIGVNSNEGSNLVGKYLPRGVFEKKGVQALVSRHLPDILYYKYTSSNPSLVSTSINMHLSLDFCTFTEYIVTVISEGYFTSPMARCLRQIRSPTYSYYFDYVRDSRRNVSDGVGHAEELSFLWFSSDHSQSDKQLSRNLVKTWIDFAYNQAANFSGVHWERYDANRDNVLVIDNNGARMATNPKHDSNQFWLSLNVFDQPKTTNCSLYDNL